MVELWELQLLSNNHTAGKLCSSMFLTPRPLDCHWDHLAMINTEAEIQKGASTTTEAKRIASFLSFFRVLLTSVIPNRWVNLNCHFLNQLHRLQSWRSQPPSIRQPGCRLALWWIRSPQLGWLPQASEREICPKRATSPACFSCSPGPPLAAHIRCAWITKTKSC